MGFFSILSTLVSTVYPVFASCKAFEDYTRVSNKLTNQNFKIAGVTIPLNLLQNLDANDERNVQIHLISIQKWLIYWIIFAIITSAENIFFLYIIPGYSILKLFISIYLIIPMISTHEFTDNTLEWKKFAENGSGLIYFMYIKPWILSKPALDEDYIMVD